MSKSYVTVAQVAIDSSSESGRRKFDSEIAMMACEKGLKTGVDQILSRMVKLLGVRLNSQSSCATIQVSIDARTQSSNI
jgi:hypothetical protein